MRLPAGSRSRGFAPEPAIVVGWCVEAESVVIQAADGAVNIVDFEVDHGPSGVTRSWRWSESVAPPTGHSKRRQTGESHTAAGAVSRACPCGVARLIAGRIDHHASGGFRIRWMAATQALGSSS